MRIERTWSPAVAARLALESDVDPGALAALARRAALAAGRLVIGERPDQVQVADTKTSPTDVVTAMDRASERLLREVITAARPHDAILGEEYGLGEAKPVSGLTSGLTWVLDPIDGTVNYLYGLPAYAVSVAVVAGDPALPGHWTPVAGCVHNPVTGQVWTAALGSGSRAGGSGSHADDRVLALGEGPDLDRALVATGFGYDAGRRAGQAQVLASVLPAVRDIRRLGSCAIDLCLTAEGVVDAYFERGIHVWDMAAAALVLTEAGGTLQGLGDAPAGEEMVVAGPSRTVEALTAVLAAARATDLA